MRMANQVIEVESTVLLGLILLVVRLIHGFFSLEGSQLLDFIMVDHQSFTLNSVIMESLLGRGSSVWCLEADESEGVGGISFGFDSDLLNWSELVEQVLELSLSPFSWEVLDVE